ncbi:MAG: hypothetical protein BRC42_10920 [Cyanobacteria bacterium QS_1_48_34]|nr:MAG: hypothetical protein BRC42_10920 [Cyanobacteria bacterium QS_1_48_34]
MVFDPDFFNSNSGDQQFNSNSGDQQPDAEQKESNQLLQYLQQQNPEVLAEVAKSASPEVRQIVSQNVQGLVGMLPSENFNVQVSTDQDNLSTLLASAMMTGYFLRQMEQRMELEANLGDSTDINSNPPQE